MKKFFKFIIVILVLTIGAGAAIFIPNKFAMATIFTNDKSKIEYILNNSFKDINNAEYYDITLTLNASYPEGSTLRIIEIKAIMTDEENIEFYAKVTEKAEEEGENSSGESIHYFNNGTLYVLKTEEDEEVKFRYDEINFEDALDNAVGLSTTLFKQDDLDFNDAQYSDFETKSTILLSFKPFMFGQKYTLEKSDEDSTYKEHYYITLSGKLKKFELEVKTFFDTESFYNMNASAVYNNLKEFTIVPLENLEDYIPAP